MKDIVEEMAEMTLDHAFHMMESNELCQDDYLRLERARTALHEDRTFVSFALNLISAHKKGGVRKWRNGRKGKLGHGKYGEE